MSIPPKKESASRRILAERKGALAREARVRQFVFTFTGEVTEKNDKKAARIGTQWGSRVIVSEAALPELLKLIQGAEEARANWLKLSVKDSAPHKNNLKIARANYDALVAARDALKKHK